MKLKQNNFNETKHCFVFVFQFYVSYNHGISCAVVITFAMIILSCNMSYAVFCPVFLLMFDISLACSSLG